MGDIFNNNCGCKSSPDYIEGHVKTPAGEIPRVRTRLSSRDKLGTFKARWGIGRMKYTVRPGLYAVGNPTSGSHVFVTANYKMSFDELRSNLDGLDCWIMVLDTKGINVWCAAGKQTFGTEEIINRIKHSRLDEIVSHKNLIVPQLGAPGVSAHTVREVSGFRVIYGPVRARDIAKYLNDNMAATEEMRRVTFPIKARAVLIPFELTFVMKYAVPTMAAFFILSGLSSNGYSLKVALQSGSMSAMLILIATLLSTIFSPLLLPWLPGKPFSLKGLWLGILMTAILIIYNLMNPGFIENSITLFAWSLLICSVTSAIAMNFTGSSTYTSLSGVQKEMRYALPAQIIAAVSGVALWIAGRFM